MEYEYENPEVKDTEEERIVEGISYIVHRKWNIKKAAEKAVVDYQKLRRLGTWTYRHFVYFS